jgi:hypothetical protein
VKGSPATFDGLLDFDTFQKLYNKDSYTFFVEMKLRTIMMNACKMQAEELQTTARTMDANINVRNQWALNLGQQLEEKENAAPTAKVDGTGDSEPMSTRFRHSTPATEYTSGGTRVEFAAK